jgi:hypothetical protein
LDSPVLGFGPHRDATTIALLIDPSAVSDTLAMWEDYLREPMALPDEVVLRAELIADAQEVIAEKRHPT